jgi:hypothetical protein
MSKCGALTLPCPSVEHVEDVVVKKLDIGKSNKNTSVLVMVENDAFLPQAMDSFQTKCALRRINSLISWRLLLSTIS